jgi:uncharacterized repeat protein (TIGR03803 family)
MTKTVQTSKTRLRAVSIALAVAIVLVPAVVGTKSAEARTFKVLYNFTKGADGGVPVAGLIQDAAGNLYGTTQSGGAYGHGTVFKLDENGKETVLYSFRGHRRGDGASPYAGLVRDAAGSLYGTTLTGGASGGGTIFKVDKTGREAVLYSFTGTGGDGANPYAGLVRDAKGNLYGTTFHGGASGYGTVFVLDTSGTETVLYSFSGIPDGANPYDALIRDSNGNLYGTTLSGGASGGGTIFKVDNTGRETVLYSFTGTGGDGANPYAGLVRDGEGNLYGTTEWGGAFSDWGTVFELDENGKETVLHSFDKKKGGANPYAGLVRDVKGNLYGTASTGGPSWQGTVFKVDKTGKETVLHSFAGGRRDGSRPWAGLVRDAKGNLYGTTPYGGSSDWGTVFKLTP